MKVGIIGCAHMHVTSYIRCLKLLNVQITGVYDHDANLATKICEDASLPQLATPEEVLVSGCDTILITSENALHLPYVKLAADAQKNIVVEKPMGMSVKECLEIQNVVNRNQVKLMVAHPVRFTNTMRDLKQLVDANEIGEVVAVNASNHGQNPGGWFIQKRWSGGGAIFDHSIHIIDLMNWLFGSPVRTVSAFSEKSDPSLEVEDSGIIQATFANHMILNLDTSWNRPTNYPGWGDATLEVITSKGQFVVDGFGRMANYYAQRPNENKWLRYEPDMDLKMWTYYKRVIEQNLPSPVDAEAGLYTVQVAEAAYQSIESNSRVSLEGRPS